MFYIVTLLGRGLIYGDIGGSLSPQGDEATTATQLCQRMFGHGHGLDSSTLINR